MVPDHAAVGHGVDEPGAMCAETEVDVLAPVAETPVERAQPVPRGAGEEQAGARQRVHGVVAMEQGAPALGLAAVVLGLAL